MTDQFSPEEVKKRGPERHLTKNYNFAGPGTEYRARMKGSDFYEKMMKAAGRPLVGTKPYNKPYDNLDKCGVAHDAVYARKDATPAQVKQADREFQKCAQEVSVGKDGVSVKLRSLAARAGFEGKIALETLGLLRKGSFASGGEKKGNVKGFVGQELGKKPLAVHSLGKKIHNSIKRGRKFM